MSAASTYLAHVIRTFESEGIRNDVRIAEHVAALLLIQPHWSTIIDKPHPFSAVRKTINDEYSYFTGATVPELPPIQEWVIDIITNLNLAYEVSDHDNVGDFFQHEIRPELLKNTSGVQYPTPHHVADFMAKFVIPDNLEHPKVIDPTTGTGGLLAAFYENNSVADFTGMDFDPQWASLAFTNLQLRHNPNFQIAVQQSLKLYTDLNHVGKYDCVLMNPPFGGSRNASEASLIDGGNYGRNSTTLLAALALALLAPSGIAAFLQPTGTLFGRSGEAHLRDVLSERYHLEAVITLPEHAMQPHSSVASHLIVVRNDELTDKTWFLKLTDDGYPAGASRDLTLNPKPKNSDLERAHDLVLGHRSDKWQKILDLRVGEVQIMPLGNQLLGIGVKLKPTGDDTVIWQPSYLGEDYGVLVKVFDASELLGWFLVDWSNTNPVAFNSNNTVNINWQSIMPASDWDEDLSTDWQGSSEDVTVQIEPSQKRLVVKQGRTEFIFNNSDSTSIRVCLLNEKLQPNSSWLSLVDDVKKRIEDISERDFSDIGALAIDDATGELCGWLIELSDVAEDSNLTGYLLVSLKDEVTTFGVDTSQAFVFAGDGFLRIENGSIYNQTGNAVRLRDDTTTYGFAIGPAPQDRTTHSLFGILIHRDDYTADMRPDRFLPEPETAPLEPPMKILARIRKGQTVLSSRVDTLLGVLGSSVAHSEEANHMAEQVEWLTDMLNTRQHDLLQLIVDKNDSNKPTHFTAQDIESWYKEQQNADTDTINLDFVTQQVHLFLRMGLLQAVHTSDQNYYRLTTQGDIIDE